MFEISTKTPMLAHSKCIQIYHHNFGKLVGLAALNTAWTPASRWCYSLQLYLIHQGYFDICHPGWIFCYVCPRTNQSAQKWLILYVCVCRGRGQAGGKLSLDASPSASCLSRIQMFDLFLEINTSLGISALVTTKITGFFWNVQCHDAMEQMEILEIIEGSSFMIQHMHIICVMYMLQISEVLFILIYHLGLQDWRTHFQKTFTLMSAVGKFNWCLFGKVLTPFCLLK